MRQYGTAPAWPGVAAGRKIDLEPVHDVLCAAIRELVLLEFDYDGLHRVVAPYCHGTTASGEMLRAIQVRGQSRSRGIPSGKLWSADKMQNIRKTAESFVPNDPHYNPNDSAMTTIHCRVMRAHAENTRAR